MIVTDLPDLSRSSAVSSDLCVSPVWDVETMEPSVYVVRECTRASMAHDHGNLVDIVVLSGDTQSGWSASQESYALQEHHDSLR